MIELSNLSAQTVLPGQSVTFDDVVVKTRNGCECFSRQLPKSVKLCAKGIYDLSYFASVTGSADGVQLELSIALEGQAMRAGTMHSVSTTAGNLNTVGKRILVENCCCDLDRISILNTGANPVTIAPGSSLVIIRKS